MTPREANEFPPDMDSECIALCRAMNRFPGIKTHDSCCGHGEKPFSVWFTATSLTVLPPLLYFCNP